MTHGDVATEGHGPHGVRLGGSSQGHRKQMGFQQG